MDRPTFLGKLATRLLIASTLVATAVGIQRVVLTGQWFIATIVAYEIAFLWIIHIRDSIAEQRWFDDGMTGERPKQRLDVRSSLFVLVLHVAMLAFFTWMGFRYDEW